MSNNKPFSNLSRKEFLKTGALSSLALGPAIIGTGQKAVRRFTGISGQARNIIFMVSDGMSSGTLTLADMVKRRQYGSASNWISLYDSDRRYHRGLMDMASNNSPVTDSAAASSSWGCGRRINNGALNIGPDGEVFKPVCRIFGDAGKKTGLVTTTRITHATPAGFSVNVPDRNSEDSIAEQYLEREYDLLLGGGAEHFDDTRRADGKNLFAGFKAKKYEVVRNKKELKSAGPGKLLGIFADSHLPYSLDRMNTPKLDDTVPSIAEMTKKALENLDSHENGFLLQVEGGRVDHGAHDNDAAALIYDQIEFDEALKVALNYIEGRDDTLLIITSDHGNANPGLNGAGERYEESAEKLDTIQRFTYTNTWILDGLDKKSSVNKIRERVEAATSIGIKKHEAVMIRKALAGNLDTPYDAEEFPDSVLGAVLANYLSVNWLGTMHTSDYVELAAIGPGSETLDCFTRNTELFDLMVEAAGVQKYAATG